MNIFNNRKKLDRTREMWLLLYIVLPLLPFFLAGFIRYIASKGNISMHTFNGSEFLICLALLTIFVNQSVLKSKRPLDDDDTKLEIESVAIWLIIVFTVLITLFTLTTFLKALSTDLENNPWENVIFLLELGSYLFGLLIVIPIATSIQSSYKLKVRSE